MLSNSSVPFQLILVHPSCPPVILTALVHTFPQSSLCTSLSVEMSIYSSVKTDFSHPPQICLSYHLSTGQRFLCIIYLGFWLVTVYTGVCFNSFVMVTWTEFRCECGCKSGRLVFMCWWSWEICVMLLWGGERVGLRGGFDCVIAGRTGCYVVEDGVRWPGVGLLREH